VLSSHPRTARQVAVGTLLADHLKSAPSPRATTAPNDSILLGRHRVPFYPSATRFQYGGGHNLEHATIDEEGHAGDPCMVEERLAKKLRQPAALRPQGPGKSSLIIDAASSLSGVRPSGSGRHLPTLLLWREPHHAPWVQVSTASSPGASRRKSFKPMAKSVHILADPADVTQISAHSTRLGACHDYDPLMARRPSVNRAISWALTCGVPSPPRGVDELRRGNDIIDCACAKSAHQPGSGRFEIGGISCSFGVPAAREGSGPKLR